MKLSSGLFGLLMVGVANAADPFFNREKGNDLVLDKFVLFGDSITERSSDSDAGFALYPALSKDYMRKLQVVNRGFSGYNTQAGRGLIDKVIDADTRDGAKIRVMAVFFGSNDAANNTKQHVSLGRYKRNLRYIVGQAKRSNIKVIVIGQALVDQNKWTDRNPDTFAEYNDAAREVAADYKVPFVDLLTGFLDNLDWKEGELLPGALSSDTKALRKLLPDGLHFSPAAYKIFYNLLTAEIATKLPYYQAKRLTYVVPQIDN